MYFKYFATFAALGVPIGQSAPNFNDPWKIFISSVFKKIACKYNVYRLASLRLYITLLRKISAHCTHQKSWKLLRSCSLYRDVALEKEYYSHPQLAEFLIKNWLRQKEKNCANYTNLYHHEFKTLKNTIFVPKCQFFQCFFNICI